jgi:PD-(D/E)XK nuclease superfamily
VATMSADFSWSVSRHDTFSGCRRRYFYSYYAAAEDPEIQRLKKLSALPMWAGNVVHEAIEGFLKTRDSLPSPEEQEAIVKAAVHGEMLSNWRESEAGPGFKDDGAPRFRLFEHEYGVRVDPEDKKIVVGIVMRSLRNFFRSELLREVLSLGRERWLTVEDLVSFEVSGTTVFLRMDLAYRDRDGRVVIVDWKTGRSEGRFNEVQMAGYALYAAQQGWVADPADLETQLAYLAIPRYVKRKVDARKLEHARAFIEKSSGSMKALLLDPALNQARIEDFAMIDRPRTCRRCNFRRLCFPRDAEMEAAFAVAEMSLGSRSASRTAR